MIKLISIYGISCLHSTFFRNKYHREESNNNASCFFSIAMEHNYTWKPDIRVLCRREKQDIYEDYFLVQ